MTAILVNIIGIILMALVIWWFMIAKPKATQIKGDTIDIRVNNGVYVPAVIQAKKGETLHLRFIRQDKSPCAEVVLFDDLNISAKLPLNKPHIITLTIAEPREYEFTCQMGMYRGKLIVK